MRDAFEARLPAGHRAFQQLLGERLQANGGLPPLHRLLVEKLQNILKPGEDDRDAAKPKKMAGQGATGISDYAGGAFGGLQEGDVSPPEIIDQGLPAGDQDACRFIARDHEVPGGGRCMAG